MCVLDSARINLTKYNTNDGALLSSFIRDPILTGRPKTTDRRITGKLGREFNDTTSYAKLIPPLDHTRLYVLGVDVKLLCLFVEGLVFVGLVDGGYVQHSILRLDILGTVEMQRLVGVCQEIRRLKVRGERDQ